MSEILAHVTRGKETESIHRGNITVVDKEYKILYEVGHQGGSIYWRSAAKPFQVLPMIEASGIEKFGFNGEEIAVMAASHNGEERHVERVLSILGKMGCKTKVLDCGAAPPLYRSAAVEIIKKGGEYEQVHNPCSGKHSSMIALALLRGYGIKDYILPDHPVQRQMLEAVSDASGLEKEDIGLGIDGCGVPVFSLPLYNMAVAYSKLALPRDVNTPLRQEALSKVANAMIENPYYVAGTGRLDTLLMDVTKGRLIAKLGAEGVYCVGVAGEGIGIALKIEDGSSRAIDAVMLELLKRLNIISVSEYNSLEGQCKTKVKNHRGEIIGEIRAAF